LRAGKVYYVGISCGAVGSTAATLMGVSIASAASTQLWGSTIGLVEIDAANSAHPLPSTWTIGAISSAGWLATVMEA
jgi:hypothetical protein